MTGEGQLLLRGEDVDTHTFSTLRLRVTWEDKGRFRKICFTRDYLHLRDRQASRIWEDGEHVSLVGLVGEDVHLRPVEPPWCCLIRRRVV